MAKGKRTTKRAKAAARERPTSIRLTPDLRRRLEALRGVVLEGETVSLALVLRMAVRRGIESIEEEWGCPRIH